MSSDTIMIIALIAFWGVLIGVWTVIILSSRRRMAQRQRELEQLEREQEESWAIADRLYWEDRERRYRAEARRRENRAREREREWEEQKRQADRSHKFDPDTEVKTYEED